MSNEELGFNIRPTVAVSEVTGYGGGCRAEQHIVYWNQASKGSDERHNFLVVCDDGAKYRFNAISNGMFVCQVDTGNYVSSDNDLILTTAGEKKRKYSQRQVEKADAAVALQEKLGWASTSDVLRMLKHNSFVNNPTLHLQTLPELRTSTVLV